MSTNAYQGSVSVKTHSLTLDHPDVGDKMELVDRDSLELILQYHVVGVEIAPDRQSYTAYLDGPIPEEADARCWISDVTQLPRLIFRNCTAKNHWARSVLIKTRDALVEGCTFTGSVLQAVHIAAEGWWHEGVSCQNVTVRNNRFYFCGATGHAKTGGVQAEMAVKERRGTPQRNLVIENNLFVLPEVDHAIHVSNAENVVIRENVFVGLQDQPVEIMDCKNVSVIDCQS